VSTAFMPSRNATMVSEPTHKLRVPSGPVLVLIIVAAVLSVHLATAGRYGHFGDELYFMACAEHLDWGYVDQPPLIAVIAWLVRHLLGTSVFAVNVVPALASSATVWLTGQIAREMGGGRFAQCLAALCSACAGTYLAMGHLFTMNVFEPLIWMGCILFVIRMIRGGNMRLWAWAGLLAGIGLENKYSIAFFGASSVAGLLLTPQRRIFASRWFWVGVLLAFAIFVPNLLWNVNHNWPFLELMRNVRVHQRDAVLSPSEYLWTQIIEMNPLTALVWLPGTFYLLFSRHLRDFRYLGWAFVFLQSTMIVLHGKDYYAAPVYPIVFAAGAIALNDYARKFGWRWIKCVVPVLILVSAAIMLPAAVPIFPIDEFAGYWHGFERLASIQPDEKVMVTEPIPHNYSWSVGWEEMTAAVARSYYSLSPEERKHTAVWADDFGAAGAIDYFGPRYGLPKAISGHQNYWLWGPRDYSGQTMILVATPESAAHRYFEEVTIVATLNNAYAPPWENRPILLCRKPRFASLAAIWPDVKSWE
jgi:hypothetical protein